MEQRYDDDGMQENTGTDGNEITLKEEVDALKKEVFLSLYNLFQIVKKHEEERQHFAQNIQIIADAITRNTPAAVTPAGGNAATARPVTKQAEAQKSSDMKMAMIIGGSLVGLMVIGAAIWMVLR